MYCEYCGAELKQGQLFCPKCGSKIEIAEKKIVKNTSNKGKKFVALICCFVIFIIKISQIACFWHKEGIIRIVR